MLKNYGSLAKRRDQIAPSSHQVAAAQAAPSKLQGKAMWEVWQRRHADLRSKSQRYLIHSYKACGLHHALVAATDYMESRWQEQSVMSLGHKVGIMTLAECLHGRDPLRLDYTSESSECPCFGPKSESSSPGTP